MRSVMEYLYMFKVWYKYENIEAYMSCMGCCYGLPTDDLIEFLMSARVYLYSNHEQQSISRAIIL